MSKLSEEAKSFWKKVFALQGMQYDLYEMKLWGEYFSLSLRYVRDDSVSDTHTSNLYLLGYIIESQLKGQFTEKFVREVIEGKLDDNL